MFAALCGFAPLHAQPAKKALGHNAYDFWKRIDERAISNDGSWALYAMSPENGDATLHVRSLSSSTSYQIPRGVSAAFNEGASHVAFLIKPPKDSVRQAKRAKKKAEDMPTDSLGILDLATGSVVRIDRVKSFKFPEEAGVWMAYHLEKPFEEEEEEIEPSEEEEGEETDKKKDKAEGTPLVLKNLLSGEERRFKNVTEYEFSEDGNWLAYVASSKDGSADGVFAVGTADDAAIPVLTGEGIYKNPVFDKAGSQLAFLSNRDNYETEQPAFSLYWWTPDADEPVVLAAETSSGVSAGWWVSEHGDLEFSKEGNRLYFGTAPRPEPENDDEKIEDEEVKLDIWNWKDPLLQPMQLVRLEDEKKRTYRAVVHLNENLVVQLADETMPEVEVAAEGEGDYRNRYVEHALSAVYFMGFALGSGRLLGRCGNGAAPVAARNRCVRAYPLSPDGQYIAWWDREAQDWFAQTTSGEQPVNLTISLPYPDFYELHDWPFDPNAYGSAGWTTG